MATISTKCNGTYGSHYTLYLGYKINSQDKVNAKSNITVDLYGQSDSSSYQAHNLNAVNPVKLIVGGSTKVDKKIAMDFRNKAIVQMASWTGDVSHDSEGKLKLKLEGNFSISGTSSLSGGSISKEWELTTIPRASSVTCADGNIGSATTININRLTSSFTHTITYMFGNLSGTIATKTAETSIGWTIPTSFFSQIPDNKSGQGTVTCQTYSGDTLIGTKSTTFNAFVINSEPTITATVKDVNPATIALTGDENKLIKYKSNAQVNITATAKNSSRITSQKVVCGGKSSTSASSVLNEIESGDFVVSCVDSRGFPATDTIQKTLIDYIKLAITNLQLSRPSTTSNTVNVNLKGNYFNNTFGNAPNTLALKYRYRIAEGTWSSYTTLSPTISGNTFSYSASMGDIYDFNKGYEFEFVATDKLIEYPVTVPISRGIPVIDIGEKDLVVNADFKVAMNIYDKHGNLVVGGEKGYSLVYKDYETYVQTIETESAVDNMSGTITTNGGDILVDISLVLKVEGGTAFAFIIIDGLGHQIGAISQGISGTQVNIKKIVSNIEKGSHNAFLVIAPNQGVTVTVPPYQSKYMLLQEL